MEISNLEAASEGRGDDVDQIKVQIVLLKAWTCVDRINVHNGMLFSGL